MEASTLTHAGRRGLLPRRSPVLRLQGDEKLVALIRSGHDRAFEVLFNRYHGRLLAFCRSMLKSEQDAEDVLQEVFAAAHKAMLADDRPIKVRPWLYRIARNRCLNHLRKPVAEGQDTMDFHPHENGTTTDDRVQKREELRQVIADVKTLPETQRTALLLREIDALSYEEIAQAMDATIPSVKSLLVRARITLAESSEARLLTCDEVRLELAEAAEGLTKASGPVRQHVKACEECRDFRAQLRSDRKALAAIFPLGPLAALHLGLLAKLGIGGGAGSSAAGGSGAGAIGGGALSGAAAGGGAAASGTAGIGGLGAIGAIGGAIGGKAAAGVATAALLTAGAVEVSDRVGARDATPVAPAATPAISSGVDLESRYGEAKADSKKKGAKSKDAKEEPAVEPEATEAVATVPVVTEPADDALTGGTEAGAVDEDANAGESSGGVKPVAILGTPPAAVIIGTGGEGGGSEEGSEGGSGGGWPGGGEPPADPGEEPDTGGETDPPTDPPVDPPADPPAEEGETGEAGETRESGFPLGERASHVPPLN